MAPLEVAETYYRAFGNLDHAVMESCVSGKAGKEDIKMAVNLFVIGKVREAYEKPKDPFVPVRITDMKISVLSAEGGNASIEADYILWMPGESEMPEPAGEENSFPVFKGLVLKDMLNLVLQKGAWRITEINRESRPLDP
jgi:hypothetical protein